MLAAVMDPALFTLERQEVELIPAFLIHYAINRFVMGMKAGLGLEFHF